jgi:hypothetical protein
MSQVIEGESAAQLSRMHRVGLPTVDDVPRVPIAIRADAKVLSWSRHLFLNDWNVLNDWNLPASQMPLQKFGLPAQQSPAFHDLLDCPRLAPGDGLERGFGRQSRSGDPQLFGDARAFITQRVDPFQALGAWSLDSFASSQLRPLRLGHLSRPRDRFLECCQQ